MGWTSSAAASSAAAGVASSVTLLLERARQLVGESAARGDGQRRRDVRIRRPSMPTSCSVETALAMSSGRAGVARPSRRGGRAARVNRRAVRSSEEEICAQNSSRLLPSEPATARIAAALGGTTSSRSSAAPAAPSEEEAASGQWPRGAGGWGWRWEVVENDGGDRGGKRSISGVGDPRAMPATAHGYGAEVRE